MEIGLLCQTTLENCLREDLLVAFNMLMSVVKGRRKQKAVFPHTRLRNSFVSLVSCRVRGGCTQRNLGTLRNTALGSQFQSTLTVREMLYSDLHKSKVSQQAPKKVKCGSKEWTERGAGDGLKIRICKGFKAQTLSRSRTAPSNRAQPVCITLCART